MDPMTRNTATPTVTAVTMRQWLTAGDGIGELRMTSVPVPAPAPHEVLIRIEALSLNYRDLLVINGEAAWRPAKPVVPVSDAAGTVTATGSEVTRFASGDRVSPSSGCSAASAPPSTPTSSSPRVSSLAAARRPPLRSERGRGG